MPTLFGPLVVSLRLYVGAYASAAPAAHKLHVPLEGIADELNLTAEQRSRIENLWQIRGRSIELLIHEFNNEGKEMEAVNLNSVLDEAKVNDIAYRQGATLARLLVQE